MSRWEVVLNTQTEARLDPAWPYAASQGFYDEVLGANDDVRRTLAEAD